MVTPMTRELREDSPKLGLSSVVFLLTGLFLLLKTNRAFSESEQVGGIWNYIQLAFILIGVCYLLKSGEWFFGSRPFLLIMALSAYMFVATLFVMNGLSVSGIYNLAMTVYAANVMITFYHIGRTNGISGKGILITAFFGSAVIVVIAILRFLASNRVWTDRGDVSSVYYVLGLLPLMMIFFSEKTVIIPMLTAAVAIGFSGKRGGMIAIVLMIVAYYLIIGAQKENLRQQVNTMIVLLGGLALIVFGVIFLDRRLALRIVERVRKLSSDGGSGRDVRWQQVWKAIVSSGPLRFIFGHGGGTIRSDVGGEAHNDFLDLFFEDGLAGLAIYVAFYASLISVNVKMIRQRYRYAAQFTAAMIYCVSLAMVSFFIVDPTYVTCGMLCLGLMLGDYDENFNPEEEADADTV